MKKLLSCLFAALFVLSSCNKDDVIEVDSQTAPRITLDSENAVYTIKSGRELTISPTYENADKALYVWKIDGKVVGTQPALTVCEQTVGELFVLLQVSNRYGTASEELRVDVVELEIPTISLPVPEKGYTILVGSPLTLKPSVIDTSIPTTCTWSVNGKEVSSEKEFTFDTSEAGDYTLEFATRNEDGEDSKEFGVKVCTIDEMPFGWTFDQTVFNLSAGRRIRLMPFDITNAFDASYTWSVNGKQVQQSSDPVYIFSESAEGTYTVKVEMKNSYLTVPQELTVNVCPAEGRYYRAGSPASSKDWNKVYEFLAAPGQFVNERYDVTTMDAACAYAESQMKLNTYVFKVEMKNSYLTVPQELTVNVCPAEGRYYRAGSPASSKDWNKVYEFLAAPGQFVNERYDVTTMDAACAYAESQMKLNTYVSLGAFGGYLVVGFDHSIENDGGYNIGVSGNSFDGSSEPGIVWVMQDENGDGLPNDTWYELKGSEYGKPETTQDYAVTYYRPRAAGMEVQWTDNKGASGSVDYLSQFHTQDYYYPAWVEADSYTLRGTCLKANNYDQSGNGSYWVNPAYDWGYADNFSPIDRLTDDPNSGAGVNANHFRISDAVTFDGKPAGLKYIDFVKVQTGIQAKSGWLGEISTEVFGVFDYNMTKKK